MTHESERLCDVQDRRQSGRRASICPALSVEENAKASCSDPLTVSLTDFSGVRGNAKQLRQQPAVEAKRFFAAHLLEGAVKVSEALTLPAIKLSARRPHVASAVP